MTPCGLLSGVACTKSRIDQVGVDVFGFQIHQHLPVVIAVVGGELGLLKGILPFLIALIEGLTNTFHHRFE